MSTEKRHRSDVQREYRNEQIVVHWEPRYCIHTGNCIRHVPEVFNPDAHPWVAVDSATADQIAEAVMKCPTGALSFERLDGGEQEPHPEETTITERPNGPLYVRGHVRITAADGTIIREATRVALCRCGQSENKPFCDLSHRKIGFRTSEAGEPSER